LYSFIISLCFRYFLIHRLFLLLFTVSLNMHFYCLLILIAYLISSSPLHSSTASSHTHHSYAFPYHTACQEHSYLTRTPSSFFLLLTRPRLCTVVVFFLLAFLLLSGDVELNPGPTSFTVCTLNMCSILHPLHSAAISDFIDSHSPDLFCLTETWIKPSTTFTELAHCTPPN